ncbi:TPA: hypothetical protein QCR18_000544 [Bacillus cereus]|uniref:hypothetical protein n=1 Tax=Bacillus cereus TaxID=1396 RepID=UPI0018CE81F7|nr:hypothetical protein [Bacillus cereus]MBG9611833.1 hypothetical protein [Bacillus cereus]MBG9615335.1 hypothetical protein [Bacillus cereus]MBG9615825.1 hypothetical protein [Bacillus cereus]HDR4881341.1 hypothetical protein [Bacillus cereus]
MTKKVIVKQIVTDLELLGVIQKFGWTTTGQLVAYLGSYSRRSILRKLEHLRPYLHSIVEPSRHIFGINSKGGALLGASHVTMLSDLHDIYDVLYRNDIWEWCGYPEWRWHEELLPAGKREALVPAAYWYNRERLHVVEIDTGDNLYATMCHMRRYEGLVKQAEKRGTPVPQIYYFTPDRQRLAWLEEALGGHKLWLRCVHALKKGGRV